MMISYTCLFQSNLERLAKATLSLSKSLTKKLTQTQIALISVIAYGGPSYSGTELSQYSQRRI